MNSNSLDSISRKRKSLETYLINYYYLALHILVKIVPIFQKHPVYHYRCYRVSVYSRDNRRHNKTALAPIDTKIDGTSAYRRHNRRH